MEKDERLADELAVFFSDGTARVIGPHHHKFQELVLVAEGQADFSVDGDRFTARAGDVVFISDLERHDVTVSSGVYKRYWLLISQRSLANLYGAPQTSAVFTHRPEGFRHCFRLAPDEFAQAQGLFENMLSEYGRRGEMWRGMLTSYLELFLIGFYRRHREAFPAESGRTAKLACEIQNYISENCRAQMTVDDIAARFFISKYYLCHVFKRQTGYPVRRFMLLQRLAAAEEMLVYSDMPVSDICTSCGFGNESNFTRSFGAVYGMSPLKYRKFANEKFVPAKGAE